MLCTIAVEPIVQLAKLPATEQGILWVGLHLAELLKHNSIEHDEIVKMPTTMIPYYWSVLTEHFLTVENLCSKMLRMCELPTGQFVYQPLDEYWNSLGPMPNASTGVETLYAKIADEAKLGE